MLFFVKKVQKNLVMSKICSTFAPAFLFILSNSAVTILHAKLLLFFYMCKQLRKKVFLKCYFFLWHGFCNYPCAIKII